MAMKNFEKQLSEGLRTHEQPNAEQVQRTVVAVQNMAAKHPPRNHRSWISFLIIQARFSGVYVVVADSCISGITWLYVQRRVVCLSVCIAHGM